MKQFILEKENRILIEVKARKEKRIKEEKKWLLETWSKRVTERLNIN